MVYASTSESRDNFHIVSNLLENGERRPQSYREYKNEQHLLPPEERAPKRRRLSESSLDSVDEAVQRRREQRRRDRYRRRERQRLQQLQPVEPPIQHEPELEPPKPKRARVRAKATCKYCQKVLSNRSNLFRHIRDVHKKDSSKYDSQCSSPAMTEPLETLVVECNPLEGFHFMANEFELNPDTSVEIPKLTSAQIHGAAEQVEHLKPDSYAASINLFDSQESTRPNSESSNGSIRRATDSKEVQTDPEPSTADPEPSTDPPEQTEPEPSTADPEPSTAPHKGKRTRSQSVSSSSSSSDSSCDSDCEDSPVANKRAKKSEKESTPTNEQPDSAKADSSSSSDSESSSDSDEEPAGESEVQAAREEAASTEQEVPAERAQSEAAEQKESDVEQEAPSNTEYRDAEQEDEAPAITEPEPAQAESPDPAKDASAIELLPDSVGKLELTEESIEQIEEFIEAQFESKGDSGISQDVSREETEQGDQETVEILQTVIKAEIEFKAKNKESYSDANNNNNSNSSSSLIVPEADTKTVYLNAQECHSIIQKELFDVKTIPEPLVFSKEGTKDVFKLLSTIQPLDNADVNTLPGMQLTTDYFGVGHSSSVMKSANHALQSSLPPCDTLRDAAKGVLIFDCKNVRFDQSNNTFYQKEFLSINEGGESSVDDLSMYIRDMQTEGPLLSPIMSSDCDKTEHQLIEQEQDLMVTTTTTDDFNDKTNSKFETQTAANNSMHQPLTVPYQNLSPVHRCTLNYFKRFIETNSDWTRKIDEFMAMSDFIEPTSKVYLMHNFKKLTALQNCNAFESAVAELESLLRAEVKQSLAQATLDYLTSVVVYYIQTFAASMILCSIRMGRKTVTSATYDNFAEYTRDLTMDTQEMLLLELSTSGALSLQSVESLVLKGFMHALPHQNFDVFNVERETGLLKMLYSLEMTDEFLQMIRSYAVKLVKTLSFMLKRHNLMHLNLCQLADSLKRYSNVFKLRSFLNFDMGTTPIFDMEKGQYWL